MKKHTEPSLHLKKDIGGITDKVAGVHCYCTELGNKLFKFIFSACAMLQISVFLSYVEGNNYEKM